MNLMMQVGEQKQSFDSPAHIHSKQSSKRIIQGPQKWLVQGSKLWSDFRVASPASLQTLVGQLHDAHF